VTEPPQPPLLRQIFSIERPPPATAATRRLRRLIALTALATVVVEIVNLGYAGEGGFALTVRTIWALLRAIGFLFLMRAVRYGRMVARPFGLILGVTTIFAVARLVVPRSGGLLPSPPVLAGFVLLTVLCGLVMYLLYRSPAIEAHLTRRPPRRRIPPWVLTTRIAVVSFSALLLVPCLVAAGLLVDGQPRIAATTAVALVAGWFALAVAIGFVMPWVTLFLVYGKQWARWFVAGLSVLVLVVQPLLCLALLGLDGVLRDGAPLVVTALLALYGLWRSRALPGVSRDDAGHGGGRRTRSPAGPVFAGTPTQESGRR
jgi:hypothetical protein